MPPRSGYLRQLFITCSKRALTSLLIAMVFKQNNRANAVNDKHVASDIGRKKLAIERNGVRAFYSENDRRALNMEPLHYYVRSHSSASYEGPIF